MFPVISIVAAVLSSLFAGVMLALAAVMIGDPVSLLVLAAASMGAWVSHNTDLPLPLRQIGHWGALLLGAFVFFRILLFSV